MPGGLPAPLLATDFSVARKHTPPRARRLSGVCSLGEPDDYLLSHGQSALSSAWSCFTVLFGMGRGGANSLWSSGMTCCWRARGPAQPIWEEVGNGVLMGSDCVALIRESNLAALCPLRGWFPVSAKALTGHLLAHAQRKC